MAGGGNRVEISIGANDNTEAGAAAAEARMKAIQAPMIKIQAQLEADHLNADANAAAAKARAQVQFEAALADIDKLQYDTEKAKAEAEAYAELEFRTKIDAADLKAKADAAAAEAKAEIKFQAVIDEAGAGGFDSAISDTAKQASQDFQNDFKEASTGVPWFGTAVTAGIVAGTPIAAGALSAAASLLMIGFAGYIQRDSAPIENAWGALGTKFMSAAQQWTEPMVQPISDALSQIDSLIDRVSPTMDSMFSAAAQDVQPLVSGLEQLVTQMLPGLSNMINSSQPIMQAFGGVFADIGDGLASVFNTVAKDAPEISFDIKEFGGALDGAIKTVGVFIDIFSKIGTVVMPILDGLMNIIPEFAKGLSAGFSGNGIMQAVDASNQLGTGAFHASQNYLDLQNSLSATANYARAASAPMSELQKELGDTNVNPGDFENMAKAIQTMGDNTQTTQARVSAFVQFLQGIGQGGQQAVNSFTAAATLDIDNMATAFQNAHDKALNADGSINQFSQSGATLQQQMQTAQSDIGSVAQAMHGMGDSSDQITQKVGQLDQSLETKLMGSLHLTKGQVDALLTSFGLWPPDLLTHLNAEDDASPLISRVGGEVRALNGQRATVYVNSVFTGPSNLFGTFSHASGGNIAGAAFGGMPFGGGMGIARVNELGPEIIAAPNGSRVIPNANVPQQLRNAASAPASSVTTVTFAGDTDGAFATAFMKLQRAGKIQIKQSQIMQGK